LRKMRKFEKIDWWKRKIVVRSELQIHQAVGIIRLENKKARGTKSSSANRSQNAKRRDQNSKRREQI
jgi:hypothetical protein